MVVKKNPFVQYRKINAKVYIIFKYEAFELDEVSDYVWTLIDGIISVADIIECVVNVYDIDYQIAKQDIEEFIFELFEKNLVLKV